MIENSIFGGKVAILSLLVVVFMTLAFWWMNRRDIIYLDKILADHRGLTFLIAIKKLNQHTNLHLLLSIHI